MKKQKIYLTERKINNIVKKVIKEIEEYNDVTFITETFAEYITDLDENTAHFIAQELARSGEQTVKTMRTIIEHMNGYGYGGKDIYGNKM